MLYFVGLGLYDEKDVTLRGLEAIKSCKRIFLESYTSILLVDKERLEGLYGCAVEVADRMMVESEADKILEDAQDGNVAFCVVGDPFGATTHSDLQLRARKKGIQVEVIHNASVMNAVGACGLQLYRFGQTVSVVFFTDTWRPDSFYDKIAANKQLGLHTLCLLDIKIKEPSLEALARGRIAYEPSRYMTANVCLEQLLEIEEGRGKGVLAQDSQCVVVARLGAPNQVIVAGTVSELLSQDFGEPLHSVVVCGDLDRVEMEMLDFFRCGAHST